MKIFTFLIFIMLLLQNLFMTENVSPVFLYIPSRLVCSNILNSVIQALDHSTMKCLNK